MRLNSYPSKNSLNLYIVNPLCLFYSQINKGSTFQTPFGIKLDKGIEKILSEALSNEDFYEFGSSNMTPLATLETNGVLKEFQDQIYSTGEYCLSPSTETDILEWISRESIQSKNLPFKSYSIGYVYRDIKRPIQFKSLREIKTVNGIVVTKSTDKVSTFEYLEHTFRGILQKLKLNIQTRQIFEGGIEFIDPSGNSIGMVYEYLRENKLRVLEQNVRKESSIFTFGFGVQRIANAIVLEMRENPEYAPPPETIFPNFAIVPYNSYAIKTADKKYRELRDKNKCVLFDDRKRTSYGEKMKLMEFLRVPNILTIK